MNVVNKRFWRLAPTDAAEPTVASPALTGPVGLVDKLSPRDGIVLASWDSCEQRGTVHGLGIVKDVEPSASRAIVD